MNAITAALVTGALVVAGKWADGKAPNIQNGIGVAGIAIGLAMMEQANERLAASFALLIVLGTTIVYFPKIAKGTGLSKA